MGKKCLFDASWHTNLPEFQGAQPDHVRVRSSRELKSLVCLRELHVASRSPSIGKRI